MRTSVLEFPIAGGGCPPQDVDQVRWDALAKRDPDADGTFVYSVRTTGVYCRPSCPARPARRENVAFHLTCEEAEQAGFRPCKRCRPNQAKQLFAGWPTDGSIVRC
jgi:methylphosphotriester-DNA--protein-cysteine methyltransferase